MSNVRKSSLQHPSGIPNVRREAVTPLIRIYELRIGNDVFGGWGPRII